MVTDLKFKAEDFQGAQLVPLTDAIVLYNSRNNQCQSIINPSGYLDKKDALEFKPHFKIEVIMPLIYCVTNR